MSDASKPVRWGILSTAKIATKVAGAMQRAAGAELQAIASRDPERAAAWAKKHGADRWHGSYQALLDDPEIDAVYIPLPPSLHAEWTIRAAEHKKHVLCEKPLAVSAPQAEEMAAACREHRVALMDGVMWVHHERTARMRQVLDDGALGMLRRVTSAFTFYMDGLPAENIRLQQDLAGGSLGDLGYYCVRAILWAFGDLPQRVFATARDHRGVDLNLSALLWFEGDRVASFDCGFDTVMRQWLEVAGTKQSLVCDDYVLPLSDERARFWLHDGQRSREHAVENCVQEVRMIERFCEMVRGAAPRDDWPRRAIDTMRVCDALAESARREAAVEIQIK